MTKGKLSIAYLMMSRIKPMVGLYFVYCRSRKRSEFYIEETRSSTATKKLHFVLARFIHNHHAYALRTSYADTL